MSRIFSSSFRQSTSPNSPTDPLLSSHSSHSSHSPSISISMQNLSPHASRSPAASPSPPPSFYRDRLRSESTRSPSPSRSRRKARTIQFAAPPPPIASVLLPRSSTSNASSLSGNGVDGAGDGRQSTYFTPQSSVVRSRRNSGGLDPLLALSRRERALQRELQDLLDAQSAGLVQGFGGGDGSASDGSSTPTYNSTIRSRDRSDGLERGGVVPVRQPRKKVLSLRGARRGLGRDMEELASLKAQEISLLDDSVKQREAVLGKVGVWETKLQEFRKKLAGASSDAEGDEEGRELAELREEERAVENEIREMEDRLVQMRARKQWIRERVREGQNRRDAKLSSYRGALREVEGEVKEFLKRPPVMTAASVVVSGDDASRGFMDLPVGRRTLGMAKEVWRREIEEIERRKGDVGSERLALDEGSRIWGDAVKNVVEFEDGLRVQMKGNIQDPNMLREQVDRMGRVVEGLEGHLKLAEDRGWNLLICALGAELEAFKEGEGILKSALGMVEGSNGGEGKLLDDGINERGGMEELNGLQNTTEKSGRRDSHQSLDREDSDDDGPPGEFLVDNSHEDGENSLD